MNLKFGKKPSFARRNAHAEHWGSKKKFKQASVQQRINYLDTRFKNSSPVLEDFIHNLTEGRNSVHSRLPSLDKALSECWQGKVLGRRNWKPPSILWSLAAKAALFPVEVRASGSVETIFLTFKKKWRWSWKYLNDLVDITGRETLQYHFKKKTGLPFSPKGKKWRCSWKY